MGHDVHFLRRLDRVTDAQVELALTLYRDAELLREVLSHAALPEGCERLAISLADPTRGPFVIVTRDGRFVTCLGEGMRLDRSATPIVTRERLHAAATRVERMRGHLRRIEELRAADGDGIAASLCGRMLDQGLRFSREDAELALGVQPLLAESCARALVQTVRALRRLADEPWLRRIPSLRPREWDLASAYATLAYATANLLVFADHELGHAWLARELGDEEHQRVWWSVIATTFGIGTYAHAHRALWAVSRRPRRILPLLKATRSEPRSPWAVVCELGLGAIAVSSTRARGEAQKALATPRHVGVQRKTSEMLARAAYSVTQNQAAYLAVHREHGRAALARVADAPTSAEIEDEDAHAVWASLARSWHRDRDAGVEIVASCLPWVAHAAPEALFLRAAHTRILPAPGTEATLTLLVPLAATSAEREATRQTGRNERCPCDSGLKFKRCCGAALMAA